LGLRIIVVNANCKICALIVSITLGVIKRGNHNEVKQAVAKPNALREAGSFIVLRLAPKKTFDQTSNKLLSHS
jgi:hypothetical protein